MQERPRYGLANDNCSLSSLCPALVAVVSACRHLHGSFGLFGGHRALAV